jgi:hypothetical protein
MGNLFVFQASNGSVILTKEGSEEKMKRDTGIQKEGYINTLNRLSFHTKY